MSNCQRAPGLDLADHCRIDLPPVSHGQHFVDVLWRDEGHHSFLRFGHEELGRSHPALAGVDRVQVHVHTDIRSTRWLGNGTGESSCPQILDPYNQAAVIQLETRFDELLLFERVAYLDGGSLVP